MRADPVTPGPGAVGKWRPPTLRAILHVMPVAFPDGSRGPGFGKRRGPEIARNRTNGRRAAAAAAMAGIVALVSGGCSQPADTALAVAVSEASGSNPAALRFAEGLRHSVRTEAMMGHLAALQDIAEANGGNRAAGGPGYDASVDYVAGVLRDNGFDVVTPEFDVRVFESEKPALTVGDAQIDASPLRFTAGTPADGVGGPLVILPSGEAPGCVPADYEGLPVEGAVVMVDRGGCPFVEKLQIADKLGAVALVVANNVDEEYMLGSLGQDNAITVPAISVSKSAGAALRANPGPVSLRLEANTTDVTSRSVIAQTRTGSTQDVVVVGAHLDGVEEGPGIDDNGSGVAAVLETAVQLGNAPQINNAVRFAFWGAEEIGLIGSRKYLESLDVEQLKDIALYLNFDMIASTNAGYFTYDGDQSTRIGSDQPVPRIPEGSAGIERTLAGYLDASGKPAQDTPFDGRSDYEVFTLAGIPAGGLFAGGEGDKTAEQAQIWGGTADAPFSPDYHTPADTIERINTEALGIHGGGVAYATGLYAQDLNGRNGIPARADRTRHSLNES